MGALVLVHGCLALGRQVCNVVSLPREQFTRLVPLWLPSGRLVRAHALARLLRGMKAECSGSAQASFD